MPFVRRSWAKLLVWYFIACNNNRFVLLILCSYVLHQSEKRSPIKLQRFVSKVSLFLSISCSATYHSISSPLRYASIAGVRSWVDLLLEIVGTCGIGYLRTCHCNNMLAFVLYDCLMYLLLAKSQSSRRCATLRFATRFMLQYDCITVKSDEAKHKISNVEGILFANITLSSRKIINGDEDEHEMKY